MALTNDDLQRIREMVHTGVADAMLDHFRECPQGPKIDVLFGRANDNAKAINGIAQSVDRLSESVESSKAAASAEKNGMSRGLIIGLTLAAAGGSAGMAAILKIIPAFFK